MSQMLEYVRRRANRAVGDPWGRASCNRVFLSVAVFLAYLVLLDHERSPVEFFLKRILPFFFTVLAGWGTYYGVAGLVKDASRTRAGIGLAMNLVCLAFHGIQLGFQVFEIYVAYRYNGGKIMIEYR